MKFVSNKIIETGRVLSDLDLFTLDFIKILRKHTNYVIVNGYVSILLGRARASEDIDIIIPKMDFPVFLLLLEDIRHGGFYCLNAEKNEDIYEQIKDNLAVRFAKEKTVIPNAELKFSKNKIDDITLDRKITVKLQKDEIVISHLEMQIAFKEVVLKSPKDMEDARHIRNIAEGHLDYELIEKYRRMLDDFYR